MPTTISIKDIIQASEEALKQAAIPHVPEATGALSYYLVNNSQLLTDLMDEELSAEFRDSRLKEFPEILKAQLATFEVFGQMLAKDTQNATVQTIITTFISVIAQFITKA